MELTKAIKNDLDNVFYKDNLAVRGYPTFLNELRKRGKDYPTKLIKFYYDNQEITQLFKPMRLKKKFYKINIGEPFSKIYMDTMYLTGANITIINVIDFFTKYALIKAFKGNSTSSSKTVSALREYTDIVKSFGYAVGDIYTDAGTEFAGEFTKFIDENEIKHVITDINDKRQTSPIETFNKTVRLLFEKYISLNGLNITTLFITIKKLNDLYNNTYHSTLGFTPLEVVESVEKQHEFVKRWESLRKKENDKIIPNGSYVRLPVEKNVFSKLSSNWSKKLYKIKKYDTFKNRYIIKGVDKAYPPNMIQYVDYINLMGNKEKRTAEVIANVNLLPPELSGMIQSFIKPVEKPIEIDTSKDTVPTTRTTRGNRVDYKKLAGIKERKKVK